MSAKAGNDLLQPNISTAIKRRPGNNPQRNGGYMRLLARPHAEGVPSNTDVPPFQPPNYELLARFQQLPMRNFIQAEYVWVGGNQGWFCCHC